MLSDIRNVEWKFRSPKNHHTCKKQGRYRTENEARRKAESYNQWVLFADMCHYWCKRHLVWHIGHGSKNYVKPVQPIQTTSIFEVHIRENLTERTEIHHLELGGLQLGKQLAS